MTEHDDKQVTPVDTVTNAEPSTGRRQFVKGIAMATPAIMTLHSGAAWALGSCQNVYIDDGIAYSIQLDADGYFYMKNGMRIPIVEVPDTCWSNFSSMNPGATHG